MESNRGKYESNKPLDENIGGDKKSSEITQRIWTIASAKGPSFSSRDFGHIMQALESEGGYSPRDLEDARELFRKEMNLVNKYTEKYSRKILEHIGNANLTDSQVLQYVKRQCANKKFSQPLTEAIYRSVAFKLSNNSNRNQYFRYNPTPNTKLGNTLGVRLSENFSAVRVANKDDRAIIQDIVTLADAHRDLTHRNVIIQSLTYTDVMPNAINGQFDRNEHRPEIHIHPVVAALFIPKIPVLEEIMLQSSIANIVKCRVNNEPIQTRPDYELCINLASDRNEFVCDRRNMWNDLKSRSLIQIALWKTVMSLRSGRYYDEEAVGALMQELQACTFYHYDAPDLVRSSEFPNNVVRRLMATFSYKPVIVQTLPLQVQQQLQPTLNGINHFVNPEMFNGEVDRLPMVNLRLTTNNPPAPPAARLELKTAVNTVELYWDRAYKTYVPKITRVVDTNGLLIIYVHRLNYAINFRTVGPFNFERLPTLSNEQYKISIVPVTVNTVLDNMGPTGDKNYYLRSAVALKTVTLPVSTATPPALPEEFISGSRAYFQAIQHTVAGTNNNWYRYDPADVLTTPPLAPGAPLIQPPIQRAAWGSTVSTGGAAATGVINDLETRGIIFVYTINDPRNSGRP